MSSNIPLEKFFVNNKLSLLKILVLIELIIFQLSLKFGLTFVISDDLKFVLLVLSPFIFFVLLNLLLELQVNGAYRSDNNRVKLRNSASIRGHEDFIDRIIEVVLFSRTKNFKNDPRGNSMLVKAAYLVSLIVIVVIISSYMVLNSFYPFVTINLNISFKDLLTGYLAAVATINGIYWLEKTKHKEKWNYLSEGYNKIINSRDYKRPIQPMTENTSVLLNALAIDILVTMMWGHRLFKELFLNEAKKALDHFSGNSINSLKMLRSFHFSESELLFILENYQLELMSYKSLNSVDVTNKGEWYSKIKGNV